MIKQIVITRPEYDYTTRYASAWAEKVLDFARNRGNNVVDLNRDRAVRNEFENVLHRVNPILVMLNGHGSDREIAGQNGEVLLRAGENTLLLAKRVVYALSCRSARVLGRDSITEGTRAYIGYVEDFVFMYSVNKRTRPLEDKTAELFFGPSNQIMMSLLKGNSADSSHQNSKRAFIHNIRKLLTSQTSKEDTATVKYLLWDMKNQVCLGVGDARI